jgi:hypothetical protein
MRPTTTTVQEGTKDEFVSISLEGSGSSVEILPTPLTAGTLVEITHDGSDIFSVVAESSEGERLEELVYRFGDYDGRVMYGLATGDSAEILTIRANGPWTITTAPLTEALVWFDSTTEFVGVGDDVILVIGDLPLTVAEMRHEGESNFQVYGYGADGRSYTLANDIGEHTGTYRFTPGTKIVTITAGGPWSITLQ